MKRAFSRYACLTIGIALTVTALGALAARSRLHAQAAPAAETSGDARAKAIYEAHCSECHGMAGQGDGPAAPLLTPRPRDFTAGKYKLRTTESGRVPTSDDLARTVRQGMYATSMPGWQTLLSDADINDVVRYLRSFSPRFDLEPPVPISPGPAIPNSPDSIARGQSVYEKLRCSSCHGVDGQGTGAITTTLQDDWRQPSTATDLTEPWTFRGGATARDIYMRLRTGMTGSPMPSFADSASDAETWDLANFVTSLARKPVWSMTASEVSAFYARQREQAAANPVKRGAYLVETLGCTLCHSPTDENKRMLPGMRLAGGLLIRVEPFGDYPTGNLTSDKETGLGNWTDDQIKQVIVRGTLPDGTRLLPFPMDWPSYSTMTDDDLNAIVAYLRTVPAVSNKVPKSTRTFFPLYMWGKFKMLILGDDPPMVFFHGNAGTTAQGGSR